MRPIISIEVNRANVVHIKRGPKNRLDLHIQPVFFIM